MSKETLKDKVYQGIYDHITNGVYKPNEILTESRLIEQFSVSKSPVREALIELCKDGILKNIPRMGYQVTPVSLKEIIDVLELRVDIELAGMRNAFPQIADENLTVMETMVKSHIINKDNIVSNNWARNNAFHVYLYSLNGNGYGYQLLDQLIKQSSRYISQYFHAAWQKDREMRGENHLAVVRALKEKDIDKACSMLETDIMVVKREILELHAMG